MWKPNKTNSMIDILKATINDAEIIAKLGKQTFIESHGHSASETDIDTFVAKYYNTKTVAKEFDSDKVHYYIIKLNGLAVGFSKIELSSPNKNVADLNITKLARLYLLKEHYGQNLGATLFNFNIELSKAKKDKGIWLNVWVENQKAIIFYKKHGFKIVGKFDYQISETHSNPNHVMYLEY
jgi:ribosomal protein S18 acetylase RimI-like enzyme